MEESQPQQHPKRITVTRLLLDSIGQLSFIFIAISSASVFAFGAAKGIDGFKVVNATHYQVFSQRGIGLFNLMAQQNAPHSVCFLYADQKPFERLEGVTITMTTGKGDKQLMDFKIVSGCVNFEFNESENLPLQIEFVDVYR